MARGMKNLTRTAQRPQQVERGQTDTENDGRVSRRPITEALIKLLDLIVRDDPHGRTFGELIAVALVRKALNGDVEAMKEITDRVEGKVAPGRHEEHAVPPVIKIVSAIPRPTRQEQPVPVSTLAS